MSQSSSEDQVLDCKDCGRPFVWSIGEQKFFEARGFAAPKRCEICRDKRKAKAAENNRGE